MRMTNNVIFLFIAGLGVLQMGCPRVCEELPLPMCEEPAGPTEVGMPVERRTPQREEAGEAEMEVEGNPESAVALAADGSEMVAAAIPEMEFEPRVEDYSDDHPDLPGMPISFNTLLLVFELGTTVDEANSVLADIGAEIVGGLPGVAGEAAGVLAIRVPTTGHEEMDELLETLRLDERVAHVSQDVLLTTQTVPAPNGGVPSGWSWDVTPNGANWGHELIRTPAMWNLNDYVNRQSGSAVTGILDRGFANSHEDLPAYEADLGSVQAEHGTLVAGVIAGLFDNGVGIDGVNPFARLVTLGRSPFDGSGAFSSRQSFGKTIIDDLKQLVQSRPERDMVVVNMSLGYNWLEAGIDLRMNQYANAARNRANADGALAETALRSLAAGGAIPIVVVSAGNDSGLSANPPLDWEARYNSPMANAAIEREIASIIVVEAINKNLSRRLDSNGYGHLSAPGEDIWSTALSQEYKPASGTSFAAPFVTGLIGYLYSLDPSLPRPTLTPDTNASPVRELLRANGGPATNASDCIDAYAAVLSLDKAEAPTPNSAPIRHALLDANGDGEFDEADIEAFLVRYIDAETALPLTAGTPDWSRYDLNGDGITGGPLTAAFDLDRVGSTRYGAAVYSSDLPHDGMAQAFDETAASDLNVLCYCAYSGLYENGDLTARRALLEEICGARFLIRNRTSALYVYGEGAEARYTDAAGAEHAQSLATTGPFNVVGETEAAQSAAAFARATQDSRLLLDPVSGLLMGITARGSVKTVAGGTEEDAREAGAESAFALEFEIVAGTYEYAATGSMTLSGQNVDVSYELDSGHPNNFRHLRSTQANSVGIDDIRTIGPGLHRIFIEADAESADHGEQAQAEFDVQIALTRLGD